ncbi:hypothetical protein, conserved [Eimeria praecox]|uniref:Uncharacterized protein n=1 Tax=Eimeria praecox TaxID=51316 RepID=U6GU70_9EIME|nr:hypothetical protein, conserved [Eimeria praecox]
MSGMNIIETGAVPSSAAPVDQDSAATRVLPNAAPPARASALEGTAIRAGDAETQGRAASAAAAAVQRTAAQAAAAQAAAASAKGAAAAAEAALAASVANEQDTPATAAIGEQPGLPESAVYSRSATAGDEAVAAAARAAAAATSAASEAASAAAAIAETAAGSSDYQTPSHLEEFLVSQGLRVAVALEAAASAAAAAADAAGQVAAAATCQAAEKSSNAIAVAAQRCQEAAASAAASAVAAFSAAASSTADSIGSTAAAARAAIGEAAGAATQKLVEAVKAFEDTIAAKTAALENALLWRESVKSRDSEGSRSRSSSSSSFVGYRLGSPSQLSSSSNSQTRGRSSLLRYFSSDYEREGSEGGAPETPLNSADTTESPATAEGKLTGDAAVVEFLAGCEEPLSRHESYLEVSSTSKGERGSSRPEQPSNASYVATVGAVPRNNSVDAIVAAAAAEAAACEALAKQQLHQHEAGDSFIPFGSSSEVPYEEAPAAEAKAAAVRPQAAGKETAPKCSSALRRETTECWALPTPGAAAPAKTAAVAQKPCGDTEERQPQQKILQTDTRHASAPPHNLTELQEQEQLQVQQQQKAQSLGGVDVHKVCEDGTNINEGSGYRRRCRGGGVDRSNSRRCSPATSQRVSSVLPTSSRLQFRDKRKTGRRVDSSSRKSRSLLESRLEDFLERCTAGQSDGNACSCSNCSITRGMPGQFPSSVQLHRALGGSAPAVSSSDSALAVAGAPAADQEDEEGPVPVAGLASRAFIEFPHFSMPTVSLQQQGMSRCKIYGGDDDEMKRLVLLFPFACVSATDLVMLMQYMEDPRLHTRIAGLEITASALEDPVSFTLLAEVLQHLQERGLLHSLLLLRITGYNNADLRASLSPERQHRIRELEQSAAARFRPLRCAASVAFAATETAAPERERDAPTKISGHCNGTKTAGSRRRASSRESGSSSNSRSSSNSKGSSWIKQPLYVPPLQLQRSLRALCRLLPQLRRLELLSPKAKAEYGSEAGHVDTGKHESTRTSIATLQDGDTTPDFSRRTANTSTTSNCYDESPVSGPAERNTVPAIFKRTVCMSCDVCVTPAHVTAAAATVGSQHQRQRFVLESVIFLALRQADD